MKACVRYVVRPSPHGGFTTGIIFKDPVTNQELFIDLCGRSGQSQTVVTAVVKALLEAIIDAALDSRRVLPILGLLGFQPTIGGHQPTNDFPGTFENLNAGLALSLGPEGWARYEAGFNAERQGEVGLLTPYIDGVIDNSTGAPDHYTPVKPMTSHGSDMRLDPTDELQGLFFRAKVGGAIVRVPASDYALIEPSRIVFLAPPGLTGLQHLIITAKINGGLRSFTYMVELQHS